MKLSTPIFSPLALLALHLALLALHLPFLSLSPKATSVNMSASTASFLASIAGRRSIYALTSTLPEGVTQASLTKIIEEAVMYSPSASNTESARVVIVWGKDNIKLWDVTFESVKAVAGFADEAAEALSKGKISSFGAGAGTILFYEDQDVIDKISAAYPMYAPMFPVYSEHSSGIVQGNVWTLLSNEKVGGSLQHYSNLIETPLQKVFDIPASWKLKSQLPFGGILAPAGPKPKTGKERVRSIGGEASA